MTRHSERGPNFGKGLLKPGALVGRYRLLGPLATGGMAQIWAARNDANRFARTLVLKVIRPDYAMDEEYRRMLIDEATAAAAVRHPNVCEVFELGSHNDTLFIAMEWVAGDTLAGLIRRDGERVPLSFEHSAKVIANACAGLHAAHEALAADGAPLGIVHRDISPQNLLLSMSGEVKLSDFGIAKARDQLHARTRTGNIKGKFAYIPPEQAKGGRIDRRADIYAMGCVLYVASTGLRPFGASPRAALSKILRGDFKAPSEVSAGYPRELEKIVVKALSLRPEDRFQTSEEFRHTLESWLATRGAFISETELAIEMKKRLSEDSKRQIRALRNAQRFMKEISTYRPKQASEQTDPGTAGAEPPDEPRTLLGPTSPAEALRKLTMAKDDQSPETKREPHREKMDPTPNSEPTVLAEQALEDVPRPLPEQSHTQPGSTDTGVKTSPASRLQLPTNDARSMDAPPAEVTPATQDSSEVGAFARIRAFFRRR